MGGVKRGEETFSRLIAAGSQLASARLAFHLLVLGSHQRFTGRVRAAGAAFRYASEESTFDHQRHHEHRMQSHDD